MKTGSKELIRDINSTLVLETIINSMPISRAAVSKKLGLTKATISAIVQDLINKNLVIEIGSDDTSLGRKPILLSFNKKAGHIICVDIGVDTISVLLTDLLGEGCSLKQIKSPEKKENIISVLTNLIETMNAGPSDTPYGLVGITLGIHGVINDNKITFAPYYDFSGIDLAGELEQYFHAPVFLENEANLSVLGEKTFMYDYPNMANISIHSGIGLGIILNDTLYTGYNGRAGELGHSIVEIDGRECPCGNHGCLEQYVSERVILKDFAKRKGIANVDFDTFASMYQTGDIDAIIMVDRFVKYMTVCVNNVLNIYNPDIVIINSSFTIFFPGLINAVKHSLTSKMNSVRRIVPSALQDSSILLGGICVVIKNFLGISTLNLRNNELHRKLR
jgi:predicted NBD/HSP70 family sugar kinase